MVQVLQCPFLYVVLINFQLDFVIFKIEKFPKLPQNKLYKNSLHYKFIGKPNIVMLSGDHWRDQRKIANPAFHRSMPVHMFGKLTQQLFSEMENMESRVDFLDLMERWTLEAIGKAGFGMLKQAKYISLLILTYIYRF
jgi:cholesterol 24(S)-hydroxylase